MYQSGMAREKHLQRYLNEVDEMLRCGQCEISGSFRDGFKSITFKVPLDVLEKQRVNVEKREG